MAQVPDGDGAAPAAAKRKPDAKQVELHKLLAEYTGTEDRANASFKGKLIQTTGVVEDVKRDIRNTVYMVVGTGKRYEEHMLQCSIDEDNADTVAAPPREAASPSAGEWRS
ncbi:OB-fold protein [Melittangium boletus]|uniref:OB-fold protein n=1 Tax=Melittangium boletus TaxID=83453 RepID=UPI003DA2EB77